MFNKKKIEELKKEIKSQDNQFNELQKKFSKSENERLNLLNENRILNENLEKYVSIIKEQRKQIRFLNKREKKLQTIEILVENKELNKKELIKAIKEA